MLIFLERSFTCSVVAIESLLQVSCRVLAFVTPVPLQMLGTAHLSGCFKLALAQKVPSVRSFLLLFYFRFLHCSTDFSPLYNTAAPQESYGFCKQYYCPTLTIAVVFFTDCFQFSGLAVDLSKSWPS